MNHIILRSIIGLLGLTGFLLASYIHNKKIARKKLICPMKASCETVVTSNYSEIFHIPVEVLGMFYYAFIGLMYGVVAYLGIYKAITIGILFCFSLIATMFSLYLMSIQAFVIKKWCTWCIFSALITITILILSYIHLIP